MSDFINRDGVYFWRRLNLKMRGNPVVDNYWKFKAEMSDLASATPYLTPYELQAMGHRQAVERAVDAATGNIASLSTTEEVPTEEVTVKEAPTEKVSASTDNKPAKASNAKKVNVGSKYYLEAYKGRVLELKLNSREDVKRILKELGMSERDLDGIWGPKTEAAYQAHYSFTPVHAPVHENGNINPIRVGDNRLVEIGPTTDNLGEAVLQTVPQEAEVPLTQQFLVGTGITPSEFYFVDPQKGDFRNLRRGLRNAGYSRREARKMMRNPEFYEKLIKDNQLIFDAWQEVLKDAQAYKINPHTFQKGGKMTDKQIQQAFIQFLMEKSGAKNELELKAYVENLGEEGMQLAYAEFTLIMQKKAKKAKQGAKLNYIKQLKHQCPEGQEPYYYKKGGMVNCGCKGVKMEDGGKSPKQSAVEKFKAMKARGGIKTPKKMDEATRDSILVNVHNDQEIQTSRPGRYVNGVWVPDRTKEPYAKNRNFVGNYTSAKAREQQKKNREKSKREGVANLDKCGGKVKKHQNGGSLNGIPFYLKGTPKGGIQPQEEFSWWDVVPYVGTYRDIRKAYNNPTAENVGMAILSGLGDVAGSAVIGKGVKGIKQLSRAKKALEANGYFKIANKGNKYIKISSEATTPIVRNSENIITTPIKVLTKTLKYPADLQDMPYYIPLGVGYPMATRYIMGQVLDEQPQHSEKGK